MPLFSSRVGLQADSRFQIIDTMQQAIVTSSYLLNSVENLIESIMPTIKVKIPAHRAGLAGSPPVNYLVTLDYFLYLTPEEIPKRGFPVIAL